MRHLPLVAPPRPRGGAAAIAPDDARASGRVDVDPQLVARVQAYLEGGGDARADPVLGADWESLYLILRPTVRASARACRRAGIEVDDVEQDAWAALLNRIPSYRPDPAKGPFLAWAATVTHHAAANSARRGGGRHRDPHSRPAVVSADPAEAIERAERRERVRRGLMAFRAEVGSTAYKVVVLHWFAGQTIDEVAARLGQTHGQVVGHINRAMPRLRAYLVRAVDPD